MEDAPTTSPEIDLGPSCPSCKEPWFAADQPLPAGTAAFYCLQRFELVSNCPNCGEHSTIVRMSSSSVLSCNNCGGSMLAPI